MNLKEMLKGNVISIGKNYKDLTGEELKLLLSLKCLSNRNNYIVGINKSILINLFKLDKRTFDKHFNGLINKEFIKVDGDISKFASVEVIKDEIFETFDVEFILNMLDDLTGAEVKLFSTLTSYLNENKNRNYIYPSIEDVAKKYYEGDLTEEDLKKKINNKGIDKLKNKLIEKGYIKKVAAYYFEKKDGTKGISKLGYFLKTDKNEVNENEYFDFVKGEINKYNENHSNIMKLATEEYLKKCKYKNLDKYIYYRHQEESAVKEENQKQVQAVEEVEPVVETEEVVVEETETVEEVTEDVITEEVAEETVEENIEEIQEEVIEEEMTETIEETVVEDTAAEEEVEVANEFSLECFASILDEVPETLEEVVEKISDRFKALNIELQYANAQIEELAKFKAEKDLEVLKINVEEIADKFALDMDLTELKEKVYSNEITLEGFEKELKVLFAEKVLENAKFSKEIKEEPAKVTVTSHEEERSIYGGLFEKHGLNK